jgi:hypothetical protein
MKKKQNCRVNHTPLNFARRRTHSTLSPQTKTMAFALRAATSVTARPLAGVAGRGAR